MDILPTCLELAGASYPAKINGLETTPVEGKSLLPLLKHEVKTIHDTLFWEHMGGKAARVNNWKIAALEGKSWELFNLENDRTETQNLAEQFPQKVMELELLWEEWYFRVNAKTVN